MQLTQVYVQKSTRTTLPRCSSKVIGSELIQLAMPLISGTVFSSPVAVDDGRVCGRLRLGSGDRLGWHCGRRCCGRLRRWDAGRGGGLRLLWRGCSGNSVRLLRLYCGCLPSAALILSSGEDEGGCEQQCDCRDAYANSLSLWALLLFGLFGLPQLQHIGFEGFVWLDAIVVGKEFLDFISCLEGQEVK